MRRLALLIFALLIASAALGWMRAGTSAGSRSAGLDGWNAQSYAPLSSAEYTEMVTRLKNAQLLPLSFREEKTLAAEDGADTTDIDDKNTPSFPRILAYDRPYIYVEGPEKTRVKFKKGDVLDSGWEIKTVDRKHVIAVFDGEEFEFPVIPYLKAAFERPDDESGEDGGDDNGEDNDDKTNAQNTAGGGE